MTPMRQVDAETGMRDLPLGSDMAPHRVKKAVRENVVGGGDAPRTATCAALD
jgi:hypothetical protein